MERERQNKDVRQRKGELRKQIAALRREVSAADKVRWDEAIAGRFFTLAKEAGYLQGAPVYLYMDIRNEAGTGAILEGLWQRGIPAALPRVEGQEIRFYLAESRRQLVPGAMGILEPDSGCPAVSGSGGGRKGLVLTPGVAFDHSLGRLGYGGGYYDVYLERNTGCRKVALAFSAQCMERIPSEKHDVRTEFIVTEKETIICLKDYPQTR